MLEARNRLQTLVVAERRFGNDMDMINSKIERRVDDETWDDDLDWDVDLWLSNGLERPGDEDLRALTPESG